MAPTRLMLLVLVVVACSPRTAATEFSGCERASTVSDRLRDVAKRWSTLSMSEVSEVRPGPLVPSGCDPAKAPLVVHEGRVIDGECLCCEAFDFTGESGNLRSLTVRYAASSFAQARDIAATAVSLFPSDAPVRASAPQRAEPYDFEYESSGTRGRFLVHVSLSRERSIWRLFLAITQAGSGE